MATQYQQGDLLLVRMDIKPILGLGGVARHAVTLLRGEFTGHAHVLEASDAEAAIRWVEELYTAPSIGTVVVPDGGAVLRHEEHTPVTVEPGFYDVIAQRQYTPAQQPRAANWD